MSMQQDDKSDAWQFLDLDPLPYELVLRDRLARAGHDSRGIAKQTEDRIDADKTGVQLDNDLLAGENACIIKYDFEV